MGRFTGILGLLTMLALAYLFSTNRRAIRFKTVAWGLGLQFAFAIFVLRVDYGRRMFLPSAMPPITSSRIPSPARSSCLAP